MFKVSNTASARSTKDNSETLSEGGGGTAVNAHIIFKQWEEVE